MAKLAASLGAESRRDRRRWSSCLAVLLSIAAPFALSYQLSAPAKAADEEDLEARKQEILSGFPKPKTYKITIGRERLGEPEDDEEESPLADIKPKPFQVIGKARKLREKDQPVTPEDEEDPEEPEEERRATEDLGEGVEEEKEPPAPFDLSPQAKKILDGFPKPRTYKITIEREEFDEPDDDEGSPIVLIKPKPYQVLGKARKLVSEDEDPITPDEGQTTPLGVAKPEPFIVIGKARKRVPEGVVPPVDPQRTAFINLPLRESYAIIIERENSSQPPDEQPTPQRTAFFNLPLREAYAIIIEREADIGFTTPDDDEQKIISTMLENVDPIEGFQPFDRASVETLEDGGAAAAAAAGAGSNVGAGTGGAATPFMQVADCADPPVANGNAFVTIERLSNGQVQVTFNGRNGTLFGTTMTLGPFAQDTVINLMNIEVVDQVAAAALPFPDILTMTVVQIINITFNVPSAGNVANVTAFACGAGMQVAQ